MLSLVVEKREKSKEKTDYLRRENSERHRELAEKLKLKKQMKSGLNDPGRSTLQIDVQGC